MEFTINQAIGDIVSIMPKAGEVFKRFNIDFCCGGHRPLSEVIKEQGLDETGVLKGLDEAYEETKKLTDQVDFRSISSGELIDYIVNTHHAYLKKGLPHLNQYATTILKVHGPTHNELFGVHKHFSTIRTELEQHMIKEEEMLFPLIKEYEDNPTEELLGRVKDFIKETEDEHEVVGNELKELRKVTKDYAIPDDVCETYEKTYDMLKELESDLFQHIHLENNILFRRLGIKV